MNRNKLLLELLEKLGMSEGDYFKVCQRITPELLQRYLNYAYVIGFEDFFYKNHEKLRHNNRPVIMSDGLQKKRFNSQVEASIFLECDKSLIYQSIKYGRKVHKKYNFEFA